MSYLLNAAQFSESGTVHATYVAHADACRYRFTAVWYTQGPALRWNAGVTNDRCEPVASPSGTIGHDLLRGEDPEKWVRAAVELAIERIARNYG